jgi:hypothetical protein
MKLILIAEVGEQLDELKDLLSNLPGIGFLVTPNALYTQPPPGLDAIFLPLPAAERWNPDFRSRRAQILLSSPIDIKKGFPPLVVTGVNLTSEDPKDVLSQTRILLQSALEEVHDYNLRNDGGIQNLGIWVMTLTNGVTTGELASLLRELYATTINLSDTCQNGSWH